jgi:hypothetical protein
VGDAQGFAALILSYAIERAFCHPTFEENNVAILCDLRRVFEFHKETKRGSICINVYLENFMKRYFNNLFSNRRRIYQML